jgi:hypothetical protein
MKVIANLAHTLQVNLLILGPLRAQLENALAEIRERTGRGAVVRLQSRTISDLSDAVLARRRDGSYTSLERWFSRPDGRDPAGEESAQCGTNFAADGQTKCGRVVEVRDGSEAMEVLLSSLAVCLELRRHARYPNWWSVPLRCIRI